MAVHSQESDLSRLGGWAGVWVRRLLVAFCLVSSASPALAQVGAGEVVEEVRFEGLETLTPDTLKFYLGLKEGEPFDLQLFNAFNADPHDWWETLVVPPGDSFVPNGYIFPRRLQIRLGLRF